MNHYNYYGGYTPYPYGGAVPDILNQFKTPYQPPMPQPSMMTPATSGDTMIWVLGEVEAQSFPVAANNSVVLWDKNNPTIYIKSASAQGVPSMRVLDFVERTPDTASRLPEKHECKCGEQFVTKDAFEALKQEFEALSARLLDTSSKTASKSKRTEEIDNG